MELKGLSLTIESGRLLYLECADGTLVTIRLIPCGDNTKVKINAPRSIKVKRTLTEMEC